MTASGVRLSTGLVGDGVEVGVAVTVGEDVALGGSVCVAVGVSFAVRVAVGLGATAVNVLVAVGVAAGCPLSLPQAANTIASDTQNASREYVIPMTIPPCVH
jgi:UDP-3-O-[3-hydroxymyristoyl] glucosamine N-acyltransferase